MTGSNLQKVELSVSTVSDDETHTEAWSLLRDFSNWGFFHSLDKQVVACSLLPGDREFCIGSRRLLQVGQGQLVEQLSALDDVNFLMSYKLVTHPANRNPFGASFVDHFCRVSLRPVTMTGQSFVEVQASFLTEPEAAEEMQETLTHLHEECLHSLVQYLRHRSARSPYKHGSRLGIGSSRPVGSFEFTRAASIQVASRRLSGSQIMSEPPEAVLRQDSSDSTFSQSAYLGSKINTL